MAIMGICLTWISPHFCSHCRVYIFSSSPILPIQDCTGTGMPSVNDTASQYRCCCQNDVVPEHNFEELSSAFSGHIVNWEFAGPTNYGLLLRYQSLASQFQGDLLGEVLFP
ncbi:hypothetical protein L6164_019629 [Bauhinia variegata]|uniref:Uncharacterized protein n=1 Tax=Bauhinia variegata TaxID=167791 RepID=A0ACB9MSG2_BAUVA|nr:hypothetical protein L6164_019629 [Bauhinia variegata]